MTLTFAVASRRDSAAAGQPPRDSEGVQPEVDYSFEADAARDASAAAGR